MSKHLEAQCSAKATAGSPKWSHLKTVSFAKIVCDSMDRSIYQSLYLSIDRSIYQSIYPSIYLSISLSLSIHPILSIYQYIYAFTYLSLYLCTYLSTPKGRAGFARTPECVPTRCPLCLPFFLVFILETTEVAVVL